MSDGDREMAVIVHYRLEQADTTLHDARILHESQGSPRSVVNRAYYAMFYSVLAVLTTEGMGAAKHGGVIGLFDRHFVKTGVFPIEMSKAIHKAFELRQIVDYRELFACDAGRAAEVLGAAGQFMNTVKIYLDDKLQE